MQRRLALIPLLGFACACAAMVGCAQSSQSQASPPPRALTIYPQKGQSSAQQNKDNAECQTTASAQANSSNTWAQIFAACMSGRGYGVQ